jgi:hypothetical protein
MSCSGLICRSLSLSWARVDFTDFKSKLFESVGKILAVTGRQVYHLYLVTAQAAV